VLDWPGTAAVGLDELLLPSVARTTISILIVAGFANIGARVARWLVGQDADADERAAGFILVLAGASAAVHALALARHADITALRMMAWGLGMTGALHLPHLISRAVDIRTSTVDAFRALPMVGRVGLVLCGVLLLAFGLGALGPPTDADSLTQHVGVPLDWLRHGVVARPEWPHARFAGLGEGLTMLGLAGGTDTLGACLQFAGLIVAACAVARLAPTLGDRVFGRLLVLGCPIMLFLGLTQKFQLLPAAATTLALSIMVRPAERFDVPQMTLVFGAVAFAIGCKYSFLFSGAALIMFGLWTARRARRVPAAVAIAAIAVGLLAAPVYVRNWSFYGDPLSPFLERFRSHPDPALLTFAEGQRQADGAPTTWASALEFPVKLIVPLTPGSLSEPLGIGALCVLVAGLARRRNRPLVTMAAAVTVFGVIFGQLSPRFFLEPYLWCASAAVTAGPSRLKGLLEKLLVAQAGIVAVAALVMAAALAPAAFSDRLRDRVMTTMASGYAESRWMATVMPAAATLLAATRSYALLPEPFVAVDLLPAEAIHGDEQVRAFIAGHGITAVAFEPRGNPLVGAFIARCGRSIGERTFSRAARNPWNRDSTYVVVAATVDWTRESCRQ